MLFEIDWRLRLMEAQQEREGYSNRTTVCFVCFMVISCLYIAITVMSDSLPARTEVVMESFVILAVGFLVYNLARLLAASRNVRRLRAKFREYQRMT